jgi:hypothetical protein
MYAVERQQLCGTLQLDTSFSFSSPDSEKRRMVRIFLKVQEHDGIQSHIVNFVNFNYKFLKH